jgi:apolipoprotein D and lipocalin family protein
MIPKTFKYLLIFALFSLCKTKTSWGNCPETNKIHINFRLNDYLGKWYEIARHKSTPFQKGECTTAEYSLNEAGNIKVFNKERVGDKINSITGEAFKTNDPFRLKIAFGNFIFSKIFKGDYRIIDTDYKNYALVYSCSDFLIGKNFTAYILSRTPELSQVFLDRILVQLEKNFEMPREEMKFDDQSFTTCVDH